LILAEKLGLEEVFVQALTSKALVLFYAGRYAEARLLLEGALQRARAADLHWAWFRAAANLAELLQDSDRFGEAFELTTEHDARGRQLGNREEIAYVRAAGIRPLFMLGRWDEALARAEEAEQVEASEQAVAELVELVPVHCEQGDLDAAQRVLQAHDRSRDAEQADIRVGFATAEARLLRAQGLSAEARSAADRALHSELAITNSRVKRSLVEALEAALAQGNLTDAEELLGGVETLQPGELTPFLLAQRFRFRARVDSELGRHDRVDENFRSAAAVFLEFGFAFYLAATQLEHVEWLVGHGRVAEAEPLLAEARETFEWLGAKPWLERIEAGTERRAEVTA
jgi:tetratricopeptide (TPR) repeat protein